MVDADGAYDDAEDQSCTQRHRLDVHRLNIYTRKINNHVFKPSSPIFAGRNYRPTDGRPLLE